MIHYYIETFFDLHNRIHSLKDLDPFDNTHEYAEIQELLIEKISHVEKKIRENKKLIQDLRKELKTKREIPLSKKQSKNIKLRIQNARGRIDGYKDLHYYFRQFGDSLAFLLINKWDIKPLAIKETPGFISLKEGVRNERKAFRHAYSVGLIAIYNDITTAVKYGDLTIIKKGSPPLFVEMKSSELQNKRGKRQEENLHKLTSYLNTDSTDGLFGREIETKRIEYNYCDYSTKEVNLAIIKYRKTGFYRGELEDGINLIILDADDLNKKNAPVPGLFQSAQSLIIPLNLRKKDNLGYFPYPLIFNRSEDLIEFYLDWMILLIDIDIGVIKRKLEGFGYEVQLIEDDEDWILKVNNPKAKDDQLEFLLIGHYLWNRMVYEFMTLKSFIKVIVDTLENAPNKV
ncbi:MAG: hypothetical protein H6559_15335 [Lewinellaceae bacterium]|nr:hypothetical protein [Lewinellaceae bacterium]